MNTGEGKPEVTDHEEEEKTRYKSEEEGRRENTLKEMMNERKSKR